MQQKKTDLKDYGGLDVCGGVDFLQARAAPDVETIITNPPNGFNVEFARRAIELMRPVGGAVALYQRHNWIGGATDIAPIFDDPSFAMQIIPRFRPRWKERVPGEPIIAPFYQWDWFIWDHRHVGDPVLKFS